MENPIKMDELGGKPTILGNIHIGLYCKSYLCLVHLGKRQPWDHRGVENFDRYQLQVSNGFCLGRNPSPNKKSERDAVGGWIWSKNLLKTLVFTVFSSNRGPKTIILDQKSFHHDATRLKKHWYL